MSDAPATPNTLLADRFRLGEAIGHGGMATVYRATDLRLGRDVAIKVFRSDIAEAVDLQRVQREVQLLAKVQSPYVVTVFDAIASDVPGLAYLVLELVEGSDLRTLLEAPRRPSTEFVRRIVADVASALEALHSEGVVHRDVKPANVLVLAGANRRPNSIAAKLSDFGIAQSVDSTRLTATNFILGTAAYLSPEQVRGARLRPASDIYSLGLMLIESLTGKPAFAGPVAESAAARLTRPPQLPRNASPALADLLSRMTAIDPVERPRAAEVATTLQDLAGGMTVSRSRSGRTGPLASDALPTAPSMPLGTAATEAGEPTTLAARPRWRKTDTVPVAVAPAALLGAGVAASAAAVEEAAATAEVAAVASPAAAPEALIAAPVPEPQPAAALLEQDALDTAQAPLSGSDADAPPLLTPDSAAQSEQAAVEDPPVALPAGTHRAGRIRSHPRTALVATLAGCLLLVGTGSVVLASAGGPILAEANGGVEGPIAALGKPTTAAQAPLPADATDAQQRTADLITAVGAREAGIATDPPLLLLSSPKTAAKPTASSSSTSAAPRATASSTPTGTPTPTSTPTPTASKTASPTPTPTKTTQPPSPKPTSTPTPTPTETSSTPQPSPTATKPTTPSDTPTTSTRAAQGSPTSSPRPSTSGSTGGNGTR